ncbi:MAG: threonine/serine dehydratase [Pseudomonadota bacterium]
MSSPDISPVNLSAIDALRNRLQPFLRPTPTLPVAALSETCEPRELVAKFELWQVTGSFKARGALANVAVIPEAERSHGVTAVSAGNHAIATAFAANAHNLDAKVVMLASASPVRVARCEAYGAEVVTAPDVHTAFDIAERIAAEERRTFIHPFEGVTTALGTAGVGRELIHSAPDLDAVIVPIGGGGLAAGVSAAIKLAAPNCKVFGVEPYGADSMHQSLQADMPLQLDGVDTIADSLAAPMALPISFALCRQYIDRVVRVSDDNLRAAMRRMHNVLGLAVEPACASALAALEGPLAETLKDCRVGLVFCGSNIDATTWQAQVSPD